MRSRSKLKTWLAQSLFYKHVLGLKEGLRDDRRNSIFLWAGGSAGMVVLQEYKGKWPTQHFAFTVEKSDLSRAGALLQEKGVAVSAPVYHEWMGSTSLYFEDPDGHDLELIALQTKPLQG